MNTSDKFFDNINYRSIIDTIRGVYASDGSMSVLLDFDRVLDDASLYAFKNWELGELVHGPITKKYTVLCVFMFPRKLMPDPSGSKRLIKLGCTVKFKKTKIKVPIAVKQYDDFMSGTRYPKIVDKNIWLVSIEMPRDLMDEIREGSIDLAGQTINLDDIDAAYDDDLDQSDGQENNDSDALNMGGMGPGPGGPLGNLPPLGGPPGGPAM